MSVSCGVECVVIFGCLRWAWKRCTYIGSYDSATWAEATTEDFDPVPRVCRLILAVYESDLRNPQFPPAGGYRLNPDWLVKRVTYEQTLGRAPPYIIYADHDHRELIVAIRGLNLAKESDYKLLLNNRLGMQMFDGGYVHHGLLKSAIWLLNQESETLKRLWVENGSDYNLVFVGHSLGSGVASLLAVIAVNHGRRLGGIPRSKVRCYAVAPARCMSLNLAVKYADVIHSVVLQDDFLPRTPTPLEDIFKSIFCLPCLLFLVCLRDTFIPEGRKLRDPPQTLRSGTNLSHCRKKILQVLPISSSFFQPVLKFLVQTLLAMARCGRFPPEVRTAIPVDGRFEHIVLSCNAMSDHGIIWIEREAEKALGRMKESSAHTVMTAPKVPRIERLQTLEKEHKDALERVVSLNVPHAEMTAEDDPPVVEEKPDENHSEELSNPELKSGRTNWDEVVEKLFKKSETGDLLLKREVNEGQSQ